MTNNHKVSGMNNPESIERESNNHIVDFLNYYFELPDSPGYAVLIKGKWGSGKTWLIKQALNSIYHNERKYLFVSLYGVTSFDQIENEFFKQLHPTLSSKPVVFTGEILKGVLRTSLKVDLDRDGRDDGSVNSQIPDIKIPKYLTDTKGFAIIFDDLERASMPIDVILGYINHFVENQGYKVVIIGNEEEIINSQEKDVSAANTSYGYLRIKEKLIGKTFEISPDTDSALLSFIEECNTSEVRNLLYLEFNKIKSLYYDSKFKNLRNLKQALWDFERFYSCLSDQAKSNISLISDLMSHYLILCFELRSGSISTKDIEGLEPSYWESFFNNDKKDDTPYTRLKNKYNGFDLRELLLSPSIWVNILDEGILDKDKIQNSILESKHFARKMAPSWSKLWRLSVLTDTEFCQYLKEVQDEYSQRKFTNVEIVKHVFGIFLFLSGKNILAKSNDSILMEGLEYIDWLRDGGFLEDYASYSFESYKTISEESYSGMGFYSRETLEFEKFCAYLDDSIAFVREKKIQTIAIRFLERLDKDVDSLIADLMNNVADFQLGPVLSYVDAAEFVGVFMRLSPDQKNAIAHIIRSRYSYASRPQRLLPELSWLERVIELLGIHSRVLKGKIEGYQLEGYKATFLAAFESLSAQN